MSSNPPPIPPRPISIKTNGNRPSTDTVMRSNLSQRFPQTTTPLLPPQLHNTNNDVLLLPQRSSIKNQRPLSSASSSESLNDSLGNIKISEKKKTFYLFFLNIF